MSLSCLFTVTLVGGPSTEIVTVDYATVDDTATVTDGDYTAKSGTLVFSPGQTSKTLTVTVTEASVGESTERFKVRLSNPVGAGISKADGIGTIPGVDAPIGLQPLPFTVSGEGEYYDRFDWIYRTMKHNDYGYFGPQTGPKAHTIPYHAVQTMIAEAPDLGHASVSETISFWAMLEAMKIGLTGDNTGFQAMWNSVEANYIPSNVNQPQGAVDNAHPADYTPDQLNPNLYPVQGDPDAPVGADPLYAVFLASYGQGQLYGMHWHLDVDGVYNYHNGDGATVGVFINNFQRGPQESTFEAIPLPCWEDFNQQASGGNTYGFLPIFQKNKPIYPSAPNSYSKQWRYTTAPDAECRLIQYTHQAMLYNTEQAGSSLVNFANKAKKMGDQMRYVLYDKYFRPVNHETGGDGAHNLIGWYSAWGGEMPAPGGTSAWSFRIGSSDCHQGYQSPYAAWALATGGGGLVPISSGAGAQWLTSLNKQLEMIRWLQTPEGPIAGGVTNSWNGQYGTPTDGREDATFYGLYYTYAPEYVDPPSNSWPGFQAWMIQRLSHLKFIIADKSDSLSVGIRPNLGIILDRFYSWLLDAIDMSGTGDFEIPTTLTWVSNVNVPGVTASTANPEGTFEYLPTLDWDYTGDYAAFWNGGSVPNPNLKCTIAAMGQDLGVSASFAHGLLMYVKAHMIEGGEMDDPIHSGAQTYQDCFDLAKAMLDRMWTTHKEVRGLSRVETRADYKRMGDPVYVPAGYTGKMGNGDPLNSASTFLSIRSFYTEDENYNQIAAYIANPLTAPVPAIRYNRFFATAELATAYGFMHKEFADVVYV